MTAEVTIERNLYLLDSMVHRLGNIAENLVFVLPGTESCALRGMGSTM